MDPTIQQLHDKLLRVEGRLGTVLEKLQFYMEEVDDMTPKVAQLEKILLFVDVDKLNAAISDVTMVSDLDRCFTTPTKPLKLDLDALLTPCKVRPPPLPPLKYVGNEDKPQNCMPPGLVPIDDLICYFNEFKFGMDKLNADNCDYLATGPCYSQDAILEMWQDFRPLLVQAESGGKSRSDMITRFVLSMDPRYSQ